MKGRRKVKLVEQPCRKETLRGPHTTTTNATTNMNHRRPMSTDDIKKAKMRARFMQHKNGEVSEPAAAAPPPLPPPTSVGCLLDKATPISPPAPKNEEPEIAQNMESEPVDSIECDGESTALFKRQWVVPPVYMVEEMWSVCCGEDSKEVEFQKKRILRERPVFYSTLSHVPACPNDPWDVEVDYDDSLTPLVPTHQLPDSDDTAPPPTFVTTSVVPLASAPAAAPVASHGMLQPDFELLAILLRNPDLVFALTSGQQAGGLSGDDTFRLLNFIRNGALDQLLPTAQVVQTLGAPVVASAESVHKVGMDGVQEERLSHRRS